MPVNSDTTRARLGEITAENMRFLCDTIRESSGIVLDESKHYLLEARLSPIVKDEGAESLDGLCGLIRATSRNGLRERVVEAMTTNETLFFRDITPFDTLRNLVIPELTQGPRAKRAVRVWSAACSSGQEAYSIAMLWNELKVEARLDITGTDISENVLQKARDGRYSQLEVNRGLPASHLVRYFERQDKDWVIKSDLRKVARWEKFNFKQHVWNYGPFEVVFCRNVLIYFDNETKAQILRKIRDTLVPGGYLFLGAAETTLGLDDTYDRKTVGRGVVYQKRLD